MKKIYQLIGITLLLVVLPAASWYFLKSGLDYRKASMAKLDDFGPLPEHDLTLSNGKEVNSDWLNNKTIVLYNGPEAGDTIVIMKLYRQFEKHQGIHFIFSQNQDMKLVADRSENFWLVNSDENAAIFWDRIGLSSEGEADVALVDIHGHVRSYYDLDASNQLRQLVEHTAFLLPVEETEKPIVQREPEK